MTKARLPQETDFEYKLRLIKAHDAGEIDADWPEIARLLGDPSSPDHLRKVAKGIMEYDTYLHGRQGAATRILSLSDFHVPYQVPVSTFVPFANRIDTLVLNGDIVDMQSISKFPKSYRKDPFEELIEAREYMIRLIQMLRPETVIVIDGNHEKRFESYLAKNLDNTLQELMPASAMELVVEDGWWRYNRENGSKTYYESLRDRFAGDIDIIYAKDWYYKIGSVIFAHPLSYSNGMLKTSEKAVEYFLRVDRDFDTMILGHTHKLGQYIQGSINMIEQGCCCDISKIHYSNGKLFLPQQMGYVYLEEDADGKLIFDRIKLERIVDATAEGVQYGT